MAKPIWTVGAVLMLPASNYLYVNLAQGMEVVANSDLLPATGKEEAVPMMGGVPDLYGKKRTMLANETRLLKEAKI